MYCFSNAAFDTIDHSIILSCLSSWFDFLWFCTQVVCLLPCLPPLLFSLCTDPLARSLICIAASNLTAMLMTHNFLFIISQKGFGAFEKLTNCLSSVKNWMASSKRYITPDKTEFILFSSKSEKERLKAYFQLIFWVVFYSCRVSPFWEFGSTRNSLSLNMYKMYAILFGGGFGRVRQFLTHEASLLVTKALASSQTTAIHFMEPVKIYY